MPDTHRVLILYGDVPLLRVETLRALIEAGGNDRLAVLTAKLPDVSGYGRIVRNARGAMLRIVEEGEATARERAIREINSGVLLAPARLLRQWLAKLKPRNEEGELYLTDIVALALRSRTRVVTVVAEDASEVQGVNDRLQLAGAEAEYRRRRAHALMRAGVTLIDPARLDVRGEVTVGRDVVLDVNVVLHGPVHLADRVQVGPNCVLTDVTVGADTVIFPNCVIRNSQIGARCQIGPVRAAAPAGQAGKRSPHRQLRRGQEQRGRGAQQGQSSHLRRRQRRRSRRQRRRGHDHLQLRRRQ